MKKITEIAFRFLESRLSGIVLETPKQVYEHGAPETLWSPDGHVPKASTMTLGPAHDPYASDVYTVAAGTAAYRAVERLVGFEEAAGCDLPRYFVTVHAKKTRNGATVRVLAVG